MIHILAETSLEKKVVEYDVSYDIWVEHDSEVWERALSKIF